MRTYMAAMQWAYSLPIGNRVQHLSAASMGALPHLRKSFANGLNKLEEIRPLLMTDAMHPCCAKVGRSVPCQWCCKTRQTSIAELRLALINDYLVGIRHAAAPPWLPCTISNGGFGLGSTT